MSLSHAILASLLDNRLTGYQLAKQFDASIGFFWQATHQQIYQELARLEARGELAAHDDADGSKRTRIAYSVTKIGRKRLLEWAMAPTQPAVIKEDMLVKCHALGIVPPAALRSQILERKAHHEARLETYRRLSDKLFPDPRSLTGAQLGQYLTLRAGIRYERAWLDWAEDASLLLPIAD